MFVHFPTPDFMGHEYGWLSPEQLSVLFRADQAIEMIVNELNVRGMRGETLFIITADHGGHDTTHGSSLSEDMTIPWIASGAGVKPAALNSSITTTDTAATAAFALGLEIPVEWDGVPINLTLPGGHTTPGIRSLRSDKRRLPAADRCGAFPRIRDPKIYRWRLLFSASGRAPIHYFR
jgi:ribosomal protein S30